MKEEVKLNAGVNTEEDFPDARIMIGWTVASCAAGIQPAIRMMTTILSAQTVDQVIFWTSRQTDVFASLAKKADKSGCRLCRDNCGKLATCDEKGLNARCQCKYGGFFPSCKPKITIIRDCREWCGRDSECQKDEKDNIFCTKCRPGYKLDRNARCTLCEFGKRPDGKGCTHCEDNCGSLAECDEEAGELGFRAQCVCKIGGEFPDCEDVDCTPKCGPGSECTKNRRGRIICTACGPDRRLRRKKCLYVGEWLQWEACSVTCGVGVQIRRRKCPRKERPCARRDRRKQDCTLQENCFGEWESWKAWSKCSRSCGGGFRKRKRDCPNTTLGCGDGKLEQLEECNTDECVAEVGDWSPWSTCPACGAGSQNRTRPCLTAPAIQCSESQLSESRPCTEKPAGTFCTAPLHAIAAAPAFRWTFRSPNHGANFFDFSCEGGCIEPGMGRVTCEHSGANILNFLRAQCKGKTRCSFRPDPVTFGLASCFRMVATMSMKCVGGVPCNSHRQATSMRSNQRFFNGTNIRGRG